MKLRSSLRVGLIVKRWIMFALFAVCASVTFAAQSVPQVALPAKRAVRIPIRHADPWAVKAMIEGQPIWMPEMSTIFGLFGAPPQSTGQVSGLFTGGHFLVNPTDNSLWWYPD